MNKKLILGAMSLSVLGSTMVSPMVSADTLDDKKYDLDTTEKELKDETVLESIELENEQESDIITVSGEVDVLSDESVEISTDKQVAVTTSTPLPTAEKGKDTVNRIENMGKDSAVYISSAFLHGLHKAGSGDSKDKTLDEFQRDFVKTVTLDRNVFNVPDSEQYFSTKFPYTILEYDVSGNTYELALPLYEFDTKESLSIPDVTESVRETHLVPFQKEVLKNVKAIQGHYEKGGKIKYHSEYAYLVEVMYQKQFGKSFLFDIDKEGKKKLKPNIEIVSNVHTNQHESCDLIKQSNPDGVKLGDSLYSSKLDDNRDGVICSTTATLDIDKNTFDKENAKFKAVFNSWDKNLNLSTPLYSEKEMGNVLNPEFYRFNDDWFVINGGNIDKEDLNKDKENGNTIKVEVDENGEIIDKGTESIEIPSGVAEFGGSKATENVNSVDDVKTTTTTGSETTSNELNSNVTNNDTLPQTNTKSSSLGMLFGTLLVGLGGVFGIRNRKDLDSKTE